MSKQDRIDVYQRVTDQIVAAIEAGAESWEMPWHNDGSAITAPVNAASGRNYRGINVLSLWAQAHTKGFTSGMWATYRQWKEIGAQVREGEKSTTVVFWKTSDGKDEEEQGGDADCPRRRIFARGYSVFNAAQVEGFEAPEPEEKPETPRIERAERFFEALKADIRHGGGRAFYKPSSDFIQMPEYEAFPDAIAYYAVLAHEATHWTGEKKRLDRDLSGRFGDESYAAEELIAELGAAFICADLELSPEPRPDHAAYISSWIKLLKEDSRAIFTAASKAQQAADFMHQLNAESPAPKAKPEPQASHRRKTGRPHAFNPRP